MDAVTADLLHRVQPPHAVQDEKVVGIVEQARSRPLLELDNDECGVARTRVNAGQHDVGAFACQRELVLHQRFDVLSPASAKSLESTARLRSHDLISVGAADRPSRWRYCSDKVGTRDPLSILERKWATDPRNSGTSQPQEARRTSRAGGGLSKDAPVGPKRNYSAEAS